ncbi:MAG TPA: type VII secretion protein EccB [Rugosimonospora sp.]|nr:type VII secretion protein EccB [Rugosimonospora sp.]
MASRRDQLQSYQFMTQRVISAFVMRETDPAQSPLRRGVGAVFAGLMIAVMVGAGFGVYGILTKVGSNNWKTDGAVVIEKESGESFLYQDGTLHPMLNYTSALLAATKPNAVFHEAANSLAGTPRGATLGIPGAPRSLPDRGKLLGLPWTLCTVAASASSRSTTVALLVGEAPAGGQSPGNEGLLVSDASNNTYLIWQGRRYQLRQPTVVVSALFGAAASVPVGRAWLNGLPEGADIAPISIGANRGQPSTKVPGRQVGDLVMTQTGTGTQYYIVFDDGLAPINELQTAIYKGQNSMQPTQITVAEQTKVPVSRKVQIPTGDTAPPAKAPTLMPISATQQLCAAIPRAGGLPAITSGGDIDQAGPGTATGSTSDSGSALADRVVVPGGHLAVVRAVETPDATVGPFYLVTDQGIRYAVTSEAALNLLGYQATDAVKVLSSLVLRIPAGPTLDPAAAIKVASTG